LAFSWARFASGADRIAPPGIDFPAKSSQRIKELGLDFSTGNGDHMFARLIAKAILAAAGIAMAFFGTCLLGMALASALATALGTIGGYALAGAVLLVPPLTWAIMTRLLRRRKKPAPVKNELTRVLLATVAKETPWIAIIGAGLASALDMFLNRNKSSK
jgi:hypothetical protein